MYVCMETHDGFTSNLGRTLYLPGRAGIIDMNLKGGHRVVRGAVVNGIARRCGDGGQCISFVTMLLIQWR